MRFSLLFAILTSTLLLSLFTMPWSSSSVDLYLDRYDVLKSSGRWREIILLGRRALEDPSTSKRFHAKVHAQLATSLFYLGEYKASGLHASQCLQIAQETGQRPLAARALYILSAQHRSLADSESDSKIQQQHFDEAKKLIDQALLLAIEEDDPTLLAKVYFNMGAAHADDPKGSLEAAELAYSQALQIYRSTGDSSNDLSRAAIRMGHLKVKQQQFEDALHYAELAEPHITTPRTTVHLLYLRAKILLHKERFIEAESTLKEAIDIARAFEMKRDLERLNALKKTHKDKT